MGKPQAQGSQWQSRKDGFFIGNKQGKRKNNSADSFGASFDKARKEEPFSKESAANSGSFFVSPSEKQHILQERQAAKNESFRFKSGREKHLNVESKDGGKKFKHGQESTDVRSKKDAGDERPKKQFDKRKWRLQKYSKKYKLQQWEEKRKKTVLHQYYKQIKDDEPKFDVQKIYDEYKDDDGDDGEDNERLDNKEEEIENENNLNRDLTQEQSSISKEELQVEPQASTSQIRKKKAFKKAHLEYHRILDEKRKRKEELERKKVERAEALKEYKKQKLEKYKKLNKKTKKGQPIMKYRMEMLLDQIQKSVQ